jgi:hypothetical protein
VEKQQQPKRALKEVYYPCALLARGSAKNLFHQSRQRRFVRVSRRALGALSKSLFLTLESNYALLGKRRAFPKKTQLERWPSQRLRCSATSPESTRRTTAPQKNSVDTTELLFSSNFSFYFPVTKNRFFVVIARYAFK